jgi:hypothetical protein
MTTRNNLLTGTSGMKTGITIFLQIIVVLVGVVILTFLLWEPTVEGRNVHATLFEIYCKDPFLAYAYIGSISVFVALYQVFKVLGYARNDSLFSVEALRAVRTIKSAALCLIGFVAVGEIFILAHDSDDHAGGVAMGVLIAVPSMVTVIAARAFERRLQRANQG